ncbi:MAG: class I SAM-dependent methyltransferase [Eubacteriales bacterium]|nr:class I SAM-dependent methyltransferase [Eubacteriales bacterium]
MKRIAITSWCQQRIRQIMPEPKICIDATAGTGQDTLFLCKLTGEDGEILAMDIQEEALVQASRRIQEAGYEKKVHFVLDGHQNMDQYMNGKEVDLIMFNLGYLPGGDHSKATIFSTTKEAVEKGLELLREGGLMTIMIYSGGDSGFAERDAMLPFLKELDHKKYTVILEPFYNKPNTPPLPVYILKN